MPTDREEIFRHYLDKILDEMNVPSIDYDKLNCIMHDANMDFIYGKLTYRQIAIIARCIKYITLVNNRKEQQHERWMAHY